MKAEKKKPSKETSKMAQKIKQLETAFYFQ
jgi:hypothetical protein